MAARATADGAGLTGSRPAAPPGSQRRRLASLLALLCLLVLVAGAATAYVLVDRGREAGVPGVSAEDEERDRLAVLQAAERFTETWNTFEPTEAEAYVERVAPLLTTRFRDEFEGDAEAVVQGITQQQLSSTGEVLVDEGDSERGYPGGVPLVGVAMMDRDSATVLVVSDAQRVANGQQVVRHWRWEVELVKVGGDWLVDEFREV